MTAFRASYADLKIVKTRSVCQVVLEIPLEQADAALHILGGVPRPDRDIWVGVARLDPKAAVEPPQAEEKPKRRFDELPLPTQAALLCQDERFQAWVAGNSNQGASEDVAAAFVRSFCCVDSRAHIHPGKFTGDQFAKMLARYRQDCGLMAEAR